MAKVIVLLASGFEEIEAVTIIDVLRRADVEVVTASLGERIVVGAHAIPMVADELLSSVDSLRFDGVVLPGGMPGSKNLRDDERVLHLLVEAANAGKLVGAICAAPIALEAAGILKGRRATGYPGHELPSAIREDHPVVEDGHIVTSRGPGTALEFALALVARLAGADIAAKLRSGMLVSSPA